MKRESTALAEWTHHAMHQDRRGDLTEALRIDWVEEPIVQVNVSRSKRNVVRGMHRHRHQYDYWYLADGELEVHLADHTLDQTLETESRIVRPGHGLVIPPGVMHGFYAVEDSVLIYGQSRLYDPNHPDDEAFYPFDERLRWGIEPVDAILSERDLHAPRIP